MTYTQIPLDAKDFLGEMSMEDVSGYAAVTIFGGTQIFGISDGTIDIWNDNSVLQYLTSAEPLNIVSTSANDTALGTGSRTVQVIGLDENYDQISEIVVLDGLTPVQTLQNYLRVRGIVVLTAGLLELNEGVITAISDSSATLQAKINAGDGVSLNTQFTVPNKKVAMIKGFEISSSKVTGSSPKIDISGQARPFGGAWLTRFRAQLDTSNTSDMQRPQVMSQKLPAKMDLRFQASTNINNSRIYARAYIILKDVP